MELNIAAVAGDQIKHELERIIIFLRLQINSCFLLILHNVTQSGYSWIVTTTSFPLPVNICELRIPLDIGNNIRNIYEYYTDSVISLLNIIVNIPYIFIRFHKYSGYSCTFAPVVQIPPGSTLNNPDAVKHRTPHYLHPGAHIYIYIYIEVTCTTATDPHPPIAANTHSHPR